jgi:putative acetyltransferase
MNMTIRKYRTEDCAEMAKLFYDTVHTVNAADYTEPQLNAWATGEVDFSKWNASFQIHNTVIAEVDGTIVGFGKYGQNGLLRKLIGTL